MALAQKYHCAGSYLQNDAGIAADWAATRAALWGAFWKNAGSCEAKHLGPVEKIKLIYRTVVSRVAWKLSRWPFQKTVAIDLDSIQCQMAAIVLRCCKKPDESLDTFFRRRLREARNVCQQSGFWSSLWCQRVINWDEHVRRGPKYQHVCAPLIAYKDSEWLLHQRSKYVASNRASVRNTLVAGRTGTRCNIGRPQTRWEQGVALAREVLDSRQDVSQKGKNAVSIGTRIRNAIVSLARNVQQSFDG